MEVPAAGASYNPSYSDHQDLLWKAAVVELNKEKAIQKIEYHTTRMFPDAKNAPTEKTWLAETSEGIVGDDKDDEEKEEEETKEGGNIKSLSLLCTCWKTKQTLGNMRLLNQSF